jgi:hypothetical protein
MLVFCFFFLFSFLMFPISLVVYCSNVVVYCSNVVVYCSNVISLSVFVNLSFFMYPISFCNDF